MPRGDILQFRRRGLGHVERAPSDVCDFVVREVAVDRHGREKRAGVGRMVAVGSQHDFGRGFLGVFEKTLQVDDACIGSLSERAGSLLDGFSILLRVARDCCRLAR
jgi:hypothetical protein